MEDTFPSGPGWARRLLWSILAVSALAAGCSQYIGTTAASFLRKIREEPDPNIRYLAYSKLAQPNCYDTAEQKAEAIQVMLTKLEQGKEPVATRAVIITTLGSLHASAAREMIVKLVSDPEPLLRVHACRALGKLGKPEDATVLTRVMAIDSLEDCRIAAIEALGDLKPDDPRINSMLIAGMRNEDPATRLASLQALRKITGKDLGVDAAAWQKILPKQEDTQLAKASTAPATAPASAPASAVYPPQPAPLQSILDSRIEMEGKKTKAQLRKDPLEGAAGVVPSPVPTTIPSGAGIGSYPPTNPNLSTAPR